MIPRCLAATVAVIALLTLGGCQKKETEQKKSEAENAAKKEAAATLPAEPAGPQPNPERNAYFGETHIHTSWSVDAWVMGNRITGPDDAYKYAQGRDHQAPDGLRHQDRHAARLHGRDRPLGVCRRHQGGQHPGVLREQAARGAAA